MRVALVHSFYSSNKPSGENEVVLSQLAQLMAAGVEVRLLAKHTDEEAQKSLYRVRSAFSIMHIGGASPDQALKEFEPDVVHVHNLFPNWGTAWLRAWAPRVVATMHNFRSVCSNGLLWRDGHDCQDCLHSTTFAALRNRCYRDSVAATLPLAVAARSRGKHQPILRHAAALIVFNTWAAELYRSLSTAPVEVVPNFYDAPEVVVRDRVDPWVFVGRLSPEKGLIELINIWPKGKELTVIGEGPLATEIVALGRPEVKMLGRLDREEVIGRMRSAKGVVIPSLCAEGMPTSGIEALATGTPLVISKSVAAGPDLTAQGAGIIYDPRDVRSLVGALAQVEARPDDMSARAATLHRQIFTSSAWLDKMLAVYSRVAGRAGSTEQAAL